MWLSEDLSRLKQQIVKLREMRTRLESLVLDTGPFLPGSLVKRYTVCGKPGCKCRHGEKHGPFLYVSQKIGGKTRYRYIRAGEITKISPMVREYQRYFRRRRKIRQLTAEIERLLDKLGEVQVRPWEEEKE